MGNISVFGYNDAFSFEPLLSSDAFAKVKAGAGNTVRVAIDWAQVQSYDPVTGTYGTSYNWDPYATLFTKIHDQSGLRILPQIFNCPSGAEPQVWPQLPANQAGQYRYPRSQAALNAFGDFAVEVLKHFNPAANCSMADAVEVWNEPNFPYDVTKVQWPYKIPLPIQSREDFVAMVQAAAGAVVEANGNGTFPAGTGQKTVVSGGLYMRGMWDSYGSYVASNAGMPPSPCYYDLGIHPTYYYANKPAASDYPNVARDETIAKYEDARTMLVNAGNTSAMLWVTEVYATSQSPWGQSGQNLALAKIADELWGKARCKAMIVHRLYPGSTEQTGDILDQCSVFSQPTPTGAAKQAYSGLWSRWNTW